MTRNDSFSSAHQLNEAIDLAVETYGALPVLVRAVRAAIRVSRPPPLVDASVLSAHLRRDVGLAPRPERPAIF